MLKLCPLLRRTRQGVSIQPQVLIEVSSSGATGADAGCNMRVIEACVLGSRKIQELNGNFVLRFSEKVRFRDAPQPAVPEKGRVEWWSRGRGGKGALENTGGERGTVAQEITAECDFEVGVAVPAWIAQRFPTDFVQSVGSRSRCPP